MQMYMYLSSFYVNLIGGCLLVAMCLKKLNYQRFSLSCHQKKSRPTIYIFVGFSLVNSNTEGINKEEQRVGG